MPRKAAASQKAVELDRSPRTPIMLAIIVMLGIGLTMGAIGWGRSDTGQIDVSATIANSQYVSDNAADSNLPPIAVATQQFIDMPNGGLVASPVGENPAPQTPTEEVTVEDTTTTGEEGEGAVEPESTEGDGEGEPVVETEGTPAEVETAPVTE
jgi:hypothetical protein